MGKRKSSTSRRLLTNKPRVPEKLETLFTCPFCNNPQSVACTIEKKEKLATVSCNMCAADYSTKANALTEPIDVYSEWIDECVRVNDSTV